MSLKRAFVVKIDHNEVRLYKNIRAFCEDIGLDYDVERKIISTECTQDGKSTITHKKHHYICEWKPILTRTKGTVYDQLQKNT